MARIAFPRGAFAHDAVVTLTPGGDPEGPGGAITLALCGDWYHAPPCPVAPHHTAVTAAGEDHRLRILFAANAADEPAVRQQIETVLAAGHLTAPDGRVTTWTLKESSAGAVRPEESEHVAGLMKS